MFYDRDILSPGDARRHANRHHMQLADHICSADIIVVTGLDAAGWIADWSARLVGQRLACLQYFDDPQNTACLSFKAAINTKRCIYFSPRAMERHSALFQLVQRACALPVSKWTLLGSMGALQAAWVRVQGSRHSEVWAVKTTREARTDFPYGMKYILSFEQMFTLVGVSDRSTTQLGVCGI